MGLGVSRRMALVLAMFLLAACGGSGGDAANARTVEIRALDTFRFEPGTVEARAGETIRFVVTNAGKIDHEFVLGDRAMHDEHERQAAEGHVHTDSLASVQLEPNETKEAVVTLERAGELLFACHLPGHYKAGMIGTVAAR